MEKTESEKLMDDFHVINLGKKFQLEHRGCFQFSEITDSEKFKCFSLGNFDYDKIFGFFHDFMDNSLFCLDYLFVIKECKEGETLFCIPYARDILGFRAYPGKGIMFEKSIDAFNVLKQLNERLKNFHEENYNEEENKIKLVNRLIFFKIYHCSCTR